MYRRETVRGGDTNIRALLDRFIAEVLGPVPRTDVARQRIRKRIHAKRRMFFVKTAKQNRPDVTLVHAAASREFDRGVTKLRERPRMVHAIDLRGVEKPLHVFA